MREAKRRNPNRPAAVYDFVRDLLLKKADYIPESERDEHMKFVGKFQQVTSPVTAKGIEDTALYIYNRLVSLNEVGGEPDRFGVGVERLHALARPPRRALAARALGDVHARHQAQRGRAGAARTCSRSCPAPGSRRRSRWARLNRRGRSMIDDQSYPSRNEEYLLYQTLLGAWPLEPMTPEHEERVPGAHRRLHAQGDARGQGLHQLDQPERARTSRR